MVSFFLLLCSMVNHHYRPSGLVYLFGLYQLLVLLVTLCNGNYTYLVGIMILRFFTMILFWDYFLNRNPSAIIRVAIAYLGLLILIAFYFLCTDPAYFGVASSGHYVNLFASDTEFGFYLIVYMVLLLLYGGLRYGKMKSYALLMMAVCLGCVYKAYSASCFFGSVIFVLGVILFFLFGQKIHLSFNLLFLFYILVNIGIIFFNMQTMFSFIIVNVLSKDLSLTGRTDLWKAAFSAIADHFLIGHGTMEGGRMLSIHWMNGLHSAHNLILEVLNQGGILGLGLYFGAVITSFWHIQDHLNQKEGFLIVWGVFCILIMNITESWIYLNYTYILYLLAIHYNVLKDRITPKRPQDYSTSKNVKTIQKNLSFRG